MGDWALGIWDWGLDIKKGATAVMGSGGFGIRYKKREQDAPTTNSYITPNS